MALAFYYDLIFAIFIPAFHSLQYLLFSWRYQLNKVSSEAGPGHAGAGGDDIAPGAGALREVRWLGSVLGWIGFTGLPLLFHASLSPDPALFGPAVFVFIFVMWINIHHYFIDNVIWRRDNEDVRKYLFAPRERRPRNSNFQLPIPKRLGSLGSFRWKLGVWELEVDPR